MWGHTAHTAGHCPLCPHLPPAHGCRKQATAWAGRQRGGGMVHRGCEPLCAATSQRHCASSAPSSARLMLRAGEEEGTLPKDLQLSCPVLQGRVCASQAPFLPSACAGAVGLPLAEGWRTAFLHLGYTKELPCLSTH